MPAARDTAEVGGDVSSDSAPPPVTEKWLSDENVLSLLTIINSRQIVAAEMELEAWHTDSIRDFALAMAKDHADIQHQIEALSERLKLWPVRPALAAQVAATFQAQIDSIAGYRGGARGAFEHAFVMEQIASHELMANYIDQLAGVAERTEIQALLSAVALRVDAEVARARAMQSRLAVADSQATVDSAAKPATRRKRDSVPR